VKEGRSPSVACHTDENPKVGESISEPEGVGVAAEKPRNQREIAGE